MNKRFAASANARNPSLIAGQEFLSSSLMFAVNPAQDSCSLVKILQVAGDVSNHQFSNYFRLLYRMSLHQKCLALGLEATTGRSDSSRVKTQFSEDFPPSAFGIFGIYSLKICLKNSCEQRC